MNESILALGTVGFGVLFFFASKWLKGKTLTVKSKQYNVDNLLFRLLSALLFLLFIPHLFSHDGMSYMTIRLDTFLEAIKAGTSGVYYDMVASPYSDVVTVFLLILRWTTVMVLATAVLAPFYDKRAAKDFLSFVGPVVILFNIIFFRAVMESYLGSWEPYHWRTIVYACLMAFTGALCIKELIATIVEKNWQGIGRRMGKVGIYFLFYLMAFMPVYAPQLLLGYVGQKTSGFVLTHRLLIYLTVLFPFAVFFAMRNKPYEERRYLLMMLALSGFVQFFAWQSHRDFLSGFPLHLCNAAIVVMFFAYAFRLKGVFYFTYFVNIMGALMAIILPNTTGALTKAGNMVFWYNHIYAVVLPLLGVALRVFDRPNLKLMYRAIAAFTVYVIFAATMDAWLNNSASLNPGQYGMPGHTDIDYFFLYSDFFINKSIFAWAYPLKYNFVLRFQVGDTLMTYYYIYILLVYGIAIALMFAFWGIYGMLYRIEDAHIELARRKHLQRVDKVNLLKELNGRSPKEPLHPEGAHMIKISHFSKTYAGSDREAVTDLNLEIHEGEVFGFIGHNGAGKSTTIKSLVGIQTITEGSIEIQGYDIARQPLEAKLNIGYVSDNHAVYEKLTGREYIGYVADLYMVSEEDKVARTQKYGELFGLMDALDREIKSYSHGMKQKLMVISALIHNPKVWILDEPLTGLDPTSSYQIKECMRMHANEGNIVFFSSHVIEVVEKICDRVAIISGGKLRRVCTPQELMAEGKSLEELYLKYATIAAQEAEAQQQSTPEAATQQEEIVELAEAAADTVDGENND